MLLPGIHHKMLFKIKNWKLVLLALVLIVIFARLGMWQLSRAHEKKVLLKSFAVRTSQAPLLTLSQTEDLRFYRAQLRGTFDNDHTLLLDNKINEGKIGYEVYTPFKAGSLDKPVLIDRGFVPLGQSRKTLPSIKKIHGTVTISGMLNVPPAYFSFGKINDSALPVWPLRIEYLNLSELAKFLGHDLCPYVLSINPDDAAAYKIKWQAVTMGPEKHLAYAVQWFALALTLLVLSLALNRRK